MGVEGKRGVEIGSRGPREQERVGWDVKGLPHTTLQGRVIYAVVRDLETTDGRERDIGRGIPLPKRCLGREGRTSEGGR